MASNAGGLSAARRSRRIDDARQLQQQRRQRALSPPAVVQKTRGRQAPTEQEPQRHSRDPTPVGASRSSSSTTQSTRRALSAKRQNMIQRRIEMRKRSEERQHQQQSEQQQVYQPEMQPQPQMQQQSILKNASETNNNIHPSQYYHQQTDPQNYVQSHNLHEPQLRPQPDDLQHEQYYHSHQGAPQQYNYQQPQHQQYSRARPRPQQHPPTMTRIKSPPTLQRHNEFTEIPMHHSQSQLEGGNSNLSSVSRQSSYDNAQPVTRLYSQDQLERSGILRNNNGPQSSLTNHPKGGVRKFSPYDSPSDEWYVYNNNNNNSYRGGENIGRNDSMQQQQQPEQRHESIRNQYEGQPAKKQQYSQPPHRQGLEQTRGNYRAIGQHHHHHQQQQQQHQHHSVARNPPSRMDSMQTVAVSNTHRDKLAMQLNHQSQMQQQQYQNQNQPNWNDIHRQYHDVKQQRFYQQRSPSRHQHLQHNNDEMEQIERKSSDQSSSLPHLPSSLSALSPVEHLGIRTDMIHRKNGKHFSPKRIVSNSVSPKRIGNDVRGIQHDGGGYQSEGPTPRQRRRERRQQQGMQVRGDYHRGGYQSEGGGDRNEGMTGQEVARRGKERGVESTGRQPQKQQSCQHRHQSTVASQVNQKMQSDRCVQGMESVKQQRSNQNHHQSRQAHHQSVPQNNGNNHMKGVGEAEVNDITSLQSDQARLFEQTNFTSAPSTRESRGQHREEARRSYHSRSLSSGRSNPSRATSSAEEQHVPAQEERQVAPPSRFVAVSSQQQPPAHYHHPTNTFDDEGTIETVSVASLRKGWEKKQQRKQQQRSRVANYADRLQANPSHAAANQRSNKRSEDSPFGVWEERANRLTKLRHKEQRREQRRNIESRWKDATGSRSSSLPPLKKKKKEKARATDNRNHHGGYQSEGGRSGHDRDQMVEGYHDHMMGHHNEEMDAEPITPQVARSKLWDDQERLRAVLPKLSEDSIGDIRDRWPDHRPATDEHHRTSGHGGGSTLSGLGSPGNYSASVFSGTTSSGGTRFKQKFVHAAALATQKRAATEQQPQQSSKKDPVAVSSHYTDSTAETTHIASSGGGSYGSSHLRAAARQHHHHHNNGRRVSPSPSKRCAHTMPPIAEMAPPLPQTAATTNTTSVAELIARINSVSRSNPEEALAAIDSIIKREAGSSSGRNRKLQEAPRNVVEHTAASKEMPRHRRAAPIPKSQSPPGSRLSYPPPPPSSKANDNPAVRHLEKGLYFREERYEEVLRSDAEEVVRRESMERHHQEDDFDDDDDDSLFSSSDDSTVSSMTDPTYQEDVQERKKPSNIKRSSQQQEEDPMLRPQKSWNTLKREYATRKASPPNTMMKQQQPAAARTSNGEDRGLDGFEFSPDDIDIEDVDDPHPQQQPPPGQSNTDDNAPRYCVNEPPKLSNLGDGAWVAFQGGRPPTDGSRRGERNAHRYEHQAQTKAKPSGMPHLVTPDRNDTAPEQNVPKRATTPEIMMAVSDAFSNVDISFDSASPAVKELWPKEVDTSDPPLNHLTQSFDGSSRQTISEAFSDVDISFGQEKTASQRRKELEQLASSWTDGTHTTQAASSSWFNNEPSPSRTSAGATTTTSTTASSKQKRWVEPTLRLKGSKSLAKKFASLVKAYDD